MGWGVKSGHKRKAGATNNRSSSRHTHAASLQERGKGKKGLRPPTFVGEKRGHTWAHMSDGSLSLV